MTNAVSLPMGAVVTFAIVVAASASSAEILSCDALKADCVQRGVHHAVCARNMKSAHLTGQWPAFRRGQIVIPARDCK